MAPRIEQLQRIRFLLTDVDGVLTDGRLYFDHHGNEFKVFHVYDGAGLAYWQRAGLKSGFLSGRHCVPVQKRAEALRIDEVFLGHLDKLPVLEDIVTRYGLDPEDVAYIGDDVLDLPVLERVGLSVAVPNGRPELFPRVDYVTTTRGGEGAVREVIEMILKAKGLWDDLIAGKTDV